MAISREELEKRIKTAEELGIGGAKAPSGDVRVPISSIGGIGTQANEPVEPAPIAGVIDAFTAGVKSGAANVRAQNKNFRAAIATLRGDDIKAANLLAEGDVFEQESGTFLKGMEGFDTFLDEPTAGINPTLINGIIDRLIKVNQDFGITLLVIEHNMRVIMQLAESIYCLAHGKMLANGTPDEIKNDKRVIDAYLGAQ